MNASRLAAWIFGLGVCTAWLASAAGIGRTPPAIRAVPPASLDTELATLAADVQTQASRLRDRLAHAPAPSPQQRNPFAFGDRPAAAPRPVPRVVPAPVVMPEPPVVEPELVLIGVADMTGPAGTVRTAMLTGAGGDLLMARAGEKVLGRYEVTAISADAVQLKDIASGNVRTLVLR